MDSNNVHSKLLKCYNVLCNRRSMYRYSVFVMFYLSKKGLPCSLHLRLSTPQFSIRITPTVLSDSIPDFSQIHNCYLIVLQSVALASTLYHNYIAYCWGCKIATWYVFGDLGVVCTVGWYFSIRIFFQQTRISPYHV